MAHPNLLDKLYLKIYPRYLYFGQVGWTVAKSNVGIVHKIPQTPPYWKIMDYVFLHKGSLLKYLGLARDRNVQGDVLPMYSLFELVKPIVDESIDQEVHHASPGDLVCVTPFDRKFIYPAPEVLPPDPLMHRGEGGPLTFA